MGCTASNQMAPQGLNDLYYWFANCSCSTVQNINDVSWALCPAYVWREGLPYIPRVHLSEGSLVRSPLKRLCSEEPMVRRSFIPRFLYSESCYIPKIPYSERPSSIWILCYEDSLVRSSSSPKGAMFRTSIFRKSLLPHTGSILRRSFNRDCAWPIYGYANDQMAVNKWELCIVGSQGTTVHIYIRGR